MSGSFIVLYDIYPFIMNKYHIKTSTKKSVTTNINAIIKNISSNTIKTK